MQARVGARHAVQYNVAATRVQGTTCGLLPFGVAVREIETKGLQWDLGGDWSAHTCHR